MTEAVNPGGIFTDGKETKRLVWLNSGLFEDVARAANDRGDDVVGLVHRILRDWLDAPAAPGSVQQDWARPLPIQQQSVLFLATRGPDGMRKYHPAKAVIRAYRACVLHAASTARPLRVSEEGDSFMSAHYLRPELWNATNDAIFGHRRGAVNDYFDHVDEVPHHYHLHLLHGAQILSHHHPSKFIREQWGKFYLLGCDDMHLIPESVGEMNARLNDFGRSPGGEQGILA